MILENKKIADALEFIKDLDETTTKETLEMCQIPAPSHQEKKTAEYILDKFKEIGLLDVHMDEVWNVLGTWPGSDNGPVIMLAAHTDTVFPIDTDVTVKKEGNRYYCPGINDDTHAVAEIMAVAKAMVKYDIHTKGDIVFCANVCEEGLGDLKGVKYIFNNENNIDAFVSVDNPVTGGLYIQLREVIAIRLLLQETVDTALLISDSLILFMQWEEQFLKSQILKHQNYLKQHLMLV